MVTGGPRRSLSALPRATRASALADAVLEAIPDAVAIADARRPGEAPLYVNPAFEDLTGCVAAELDSAFPHVEDPAERQRLEQSIRQGLSESRILHCRRGEETFWCEVSLHPLPTEAASRPACVVVQRDLTRWRQVEAQLRRTNEELATAVEEVGRRSLQMLALNQTVDRLQSCDGQEHARKIVADQMVEIFPQTPGSVWLLEPDGSLRRLSAWAGLDTPDGPFKRGDCRALRDGVELAQGAEDVEDRCPHLPPPGGSSVDLCLPLRAPRPLGVLHLRLPLDSGQANQPRLRERLRPLLRFGSNVAHQVALGLENVARRTALHAQATRDPVTGLYNRRYLDDSIDREVSRAVRNRSGLGLLMVDLDDFKLFNDSFGHDAGDALLRQFASLMGRELRRGDVIARYGGDEFIVLMPEATLETARRLAERLLERARSLGVEHDGRRLGPVTLSIGAAAIPESGGGASGLLKAADHALYRAKKEGRDRVICADPGVSFPSGSATGRPARG